MRSTILSHPGKKAWPIAIVLFLSALSIQYSKAQITINSISATPSTCPNNGTISVNAQGTNPPLYYNITAGPSIQPIQTGSIFNSMEPGTYTVRVSDGLGNEVLRNITVTGTYQYLDFSPTRTHPSCPGSSDGRIVGNRITNTGKGPFTWQLIAPSQVTSAPQNSDTFENLPAGNYTLRVTDDCGTFRTLVVTLNNPSSSSLTLWNSNIEIGCNQGLAKLSFQAGVYHFPMTFRFETNHGTITTTTPTQIVMGSSNNAGGGYFDVHQILPLFTYGNYLRVTVTDNCGNTLVTPLRYGTNFNFCPSFNSKFADCDYLTNISLFLNATGCSNSTHMTTLMSPPVSYQFINVATGVVADAGTLLNPAAGVRSKPLTGNTQYNVIIQDGCGNTFSNTYTINNPVMPVPTYTQRLERRGCLDSVTTVHINTDNFRSVPSLILLSGPSTLSSTKPNYSYNGTYAYPDTFRYTSWGGGVDNRYNFSLQNLTPGTYHYKLIDSCGTERFDSFIIRKTDVTDLAHKFSYKKGCLGRNQIHVNIKETRGGTLQIGPPLNINKYYSNVSSINDSVLNIPSGTYQITFTYGSIPGSTPANENPIACQRITETITIEGYETPSIYTNNSLICDNTINIELIPDSSRGVPPYQYEIISGPETFPIQNSNLFTVSATGIYTARIYDVCGNASAKQISVDTLSNPFTPANIVRDCARIRFKFPTSMYYTYEWTRPDLSKFYADSLVLDPIMPSDTGIYHIARTTDINGCKKVVTTSYHVTMSNIAPISHTICSDETITIGSSTYAATGIYHDTLVSQNGCDSIVQLHLTVIDYKRHSFPAVICPGEDIFFGGQLCTLPGIYHDTIPTSTCDSIVTMTLTLAPVPMVSLGNDTSLCTGESLLLDAGTQHHTYRWNNDPLLTSHSLMVNSVGKNSVVVTNVEGCSATDTMEIIQIHPLPIANAGPDQGICAGQTGTLTASGGASYQWLPGGETSSTLQVRPSVTSHYVLIVYSTHGCTSVDTVTVHISSPSPESPFDQASVEHCFEDEPYTIQARGKSFLWNQTGDTTHYLVIHQAGIYQVTTTDENGCSSRGEIIIEESCLPRLFVPSAFSPNGDGTNDELEIFGKYFRDFELKIFNRWGEIIFISNDRHKTWDGMYRNEEMPIGTYPWIIHYKNENDPEEKTMKGSVTLIR